MSASLARVAQKRGAFQLASPDPAAAHTALTKTQAIWSALRMAWQWLHQAASILQNHDHLAGAGVQEQLQAHVRTMQIIRTRRSSGRCGRVFSQKSTANYAPGLFYTYDVRMCRLP